MPLEGSFISLFYYQDQCTVHKTSGQYISPPAILPSWLQFSLEFYRMHFLCFSCSFESNTVIFWKFLYNTIQQSPDIPMILYAVGALKTLNVWPKYKVNKTLFKIEIGRGVQCEKTKNSIFELSCHPILMKIGTRLLSVWIKLKQSENENMNL